MASLYKTEEGSLRAQIAKRGVRLLGTFSTKAAATAWATEKEHAIDKGTCRGAGTRTVADLLTEYERRVSCGSCSR